MTAERCTIGVDIGGTKVAAGLVQFPSAIILHRETVATRAERGGGVVLDDVDAMVKRLVEYARSQNFVPSGMGISVPELVDQNGEITSSATIDWRGIKLQTRFNELGKVFIDSDVRAAARAEAQFGAGRDFRLFVYINVGTGISYCLVQEGQPFAGARGNALILGSGPEVSYCNVCGSKVVATLEDVASGSGLVRSYQAERSSPLTTAEEILGAAATGDSAALRVVTRAGEILGNRVGLLINLLDPEAVIVGGGLGLAGGIYWQTFCDATRASIWAANTRDLKILPCALGRDAGVIGAALLASYRIA